MCKTTRATAARCSLVLFWALAAGACSHAESMTEPAQDFSVSIEQELSVPHSVGQGILRLVNSEIASLEFLEGVAELDPRAVEVIVAKRAGADGETGTLDDDIFETVFELDAVPYVDTFALMRLGALARDLDLVPLLLLEGVPFSEGELNSTVLLANFGSLAELDQDASLDVRAAEAIIHGRPYQDIWQLADRPFMGPGSLRNLRDFSRYWLADRLMDQGE